MVKQRQKMIRNWYSLTEEMNQKFRQKALADGFIAREALYHLIEAYVEGRFDMEEDD